VSGVVCLIKYTHKGEGRLINYLADRFAAARGNQTVQLLKKKHPSSQATLEKYVYVKKNPRRNAR